MFKNRLCENMNLLIHSAQQHEQMVSQNSPGHIYMCIKKNGLNTNKNLSRKFTHLRKSHSKKKSEFCKTATDAYTFSISSPIQ